MSVMLGIFFYKKFSISRRAGVGTRKGEGGYGCMTLYHRLLPKLDPPVITKLDKVVLSHPIVGQNGLISSHSWTKSSSIIPQLDKMVLYHPTVG